MATRTTTTKTKSKTTKTAAKTTVKKDAKVFVFFNCDEEKSEKSMNIFYNNEVFKDTKTSKKALWAKVLEEVEVGRVQIADENLKAAQEAVTNGNPCDASQYLHFGEIVEVLCH